MNEKEIKKLVEMYKESISTSEGKELERMLVRFAKEVERETRHNAVKLAYDLANNINALKD
jgi:hypothetical protein